MPNIGREPTAISLFAGCGGDSLGLESAGFKVLAFSENWKPAIKTHSVNLPGKIHLGADVRGDIRQIPDSEFAKFEGKVDLLFAGFPCQGFSHAGKKDPNDPRNRLFWEFVRAADAIRPRWVVGENVWGLLHRRTEDGMGTADQVVVDAFEETGYKMAAPFILNAVDFGVPEERRRVFFVGSRDGIPFAPPIPRAPRKRLKALPSIRSSVEFSLEGAVPITTREVAGGIGSYCESSNGEVPRGVPHPYLRRMVDRGLMSYGKRLSPYHAEVVDLDSPSKTIHSGYLFAPRLFPAMMTERGYFLRTFLPDELAMIQGFPSTYRILGTTADAIKQIGNAVPPPLAAAVARRVLECDPELGGEPAARPGLLSWAASAPTP